jgi:hypothetical protein
MYIQFKMTGFNELNGYLSRIRVDTPKKADAIAEDIAKSVQRRARTRLTLSGVKQRTGRLYKSMRAERVGKDWVVGIDVPYYGIIIEKGQKPHEIFAKRGAMSFYWERLGRQVALSRVSHPGFAGVHFFEDAINGAAMEGNSIAKKRINELLTG